MIEAVVIGAGQVGLAASWHLTDRSVEHVVLERGLVAQTWRTERWDSFALNTPNWMNRMPGEVEAIEPRDAFLTRDALVDRFDAYAERHRLPIRLGVEVISVEPGRREGTFVVTTTGDGAVEPIETRHVVVASGGQPRARRPALAARLPASVRELHSAEYRSPADLPPGAVLVVGSAQSGVQIAEDLVSGGREVYLATSAAGRLRRRQRGRDSLEWLTENGFYDMTADDLADPQGKTTPIPQISGVGRYGHTVSLQSLERLGVRLLGRPVGIDGPRLSLDGSLGANIALGDSISDELNTLIERRIRESGATPEPLEPDPADEPHPDPLSVHSPETLDLEADGVSTVLWATGFTADFTYLHVPVLDDDGIPIHDHGAARVPGIHFLGLRWLNNRRSALLNAAAPEAGAMADRITGSVARPDRSGR